MKVRIFFLIIGNLLLATRGTSRNQEWSEQFSAFQKAISEASDKQNCSLQLIKLVESAENGPSNLDEIWQSKLRDDLFKKPTCTPSLPNLQEIDFIDDESAPYLHKVLVNMAISELYYRGEKPDFSSPNLSFFGDLDPVYTDLKDVLKKITDRKDLDEKDNKFLNYFMNTAWDVVVFDGQTLEKTIRIVTHIAYKVLNDLNAPNILALRNNIWNLSREQFIELIKETIITRLTFHKIRQLVNGSNDLLWTIISSTHHKDLLQILYLLVNIFDGREISSSIPILEKLCAGRLVRIIRILLHKSVLNVIRGDKVEAFKIFDNLYEVLKEKEGVENMKRRLYCSDTSYLINTVQAILLQTRPPKILIEQSPGQVLKFITELMETGDPRCVDLATKIAAIPIKLELAPELSSSHRE